ncbi:F-box associated domain type 3, partial [Arabidopsis thaliana x Arabidopsis arenosa]
RRRGDDWVAPEIPLDLLIEILTKLPAKSLMRFMCVSKLWFSLIRSRYFSNRYLTVASPPQPPRLYMSLVDHIQCNSMEVCYNPRESVLLSLSSSSSTDAKSFHQDLTMPGMGGRNMMILRGLILYIVCRKACIYNPTTKQCVTLPAVQSNIFAQEDYHKSVLYFLGHDPVLDQYKVVCTVAVSSKRFKRITSEHWVFVLEPGGSWKRIEFDQPHCPTRLGLCINGVIYFLASACMSGDILVSFDVMSEEFKWIQGPPVASAFMPMGFIEYCGKPSVFDHSHLKRKGSVDLWVLEDAGKWSKKSLVLQPCQMHLVDKKLSYKVKGTTRNGEIILAPFLLRSPYYVLYYDPKKNDLRKVRIRGIPAQWLRNDHSVLYFLGHDPVLDQYKVVCNFVSSSSQDLDMINSEHWVFVLEVGGSWKRIEFDQPHISTRPGLCIGGVIYYLAFTSMFEDIVVSFDVRSEEFNIIQAPLVVSAYVDSLGFIEYGGKPAIFYHTSLKENGLVDLWVLENAGNWLRKAL